jgi:transcriptional regulator with XRE-family HTH domain
MENSPMNAGKMVIGKKIEQLLTEKGMSQADLAEKAEVTRAAISQIVAGKRVPTLPVLRKLARVLSVSIDHLAGGSSKTDVEAVLKNDPNQIEFFRNFQSLDPHVQEIIKKQVEALKSKGNK